ncbi:MAG TPA: hypothetical protein VF572_02205 [Candidatus Saccharimonadales bacterium]|jgi:guanylate kinase
MARYFQDPGLVVALIAPSAVGKSWTALQLAAEGVVATAPSYTTRPPRPGETDTDYDHVFVDEPTFDAYSQAGGFAVQAELYGNRYGLPPLDPLEDIGPLDPLARLVLLKDTVVEDFRDVYPGARVYHIESEDSEARMEEIMLARGQDPADIEERRSEYQRELERGRALADQVFVSPGHPRHNLASIKAAIGRDRQAYDGLSGF